MDTSPHNLSKHKITFCTHSHALAHFAIYFPPAALGFSSKLFEIQGLVTGIDGELGEPGWSYARVTGDLSLAGRVDLGFTQ